ncbi:uncharacterized protein LOC132014850 [Mustela nigripes]|uniref:uncharacterized protein LOC132014850 n=1 Tax=Mustela nigripes TaxID=77151 RepID=UPI002814B962|nr:uncharacterized protein LOC132014850 [Mustela nigripes]
MGAGSEGGEKLTGSGCTSVEAEVMGGDGDCPRAGLECLLVERVEPGGGTGEEEEKSSSYLRVYRGLDSWMGGWNWKRQAHVEPDALQEHALNVPIIPAVSPTGRLRDGLAPSGMAPSTLQAAHALEHGGGARCRAAARPPARAVSEQQWGRPWEAWRAEACGRMSASARQRRRRPTPISGCPSPGHCFVSNLGSCSSYPQNLTRPVHWRRLCLFELRLGGVNNKPLLLVLLAVEVLCSLARPAPGS